MHDSDAPLLPPIPLPEPEQTTASPTVRPYFPASHPNWCSGCGEEFVQGDMIRGDGCGGYFAECCGGDQAAELRRLRAAVSASHDIPSSRHPDKPPRPPAATTGPHRNAPTPTARHRQEHPPMFDSIEAVTHTGDTRTIPIPNRTPVDRDAITRTRTDHGLRLHLVDTLWGHDRPAPTGAAQIGGYIYEIADRLATALEADLHAQPAAWKCVCGHLNEGFWTSRDTCHSCRVVAADPSQVAAHYRLVRQPTDNGFFAARLAVETAAARARLLHATPAELVAAHAESDTLCTTCISPAPCPTRRALDGEE